MTSVLGETQESYHHSHFLLRLRRPYSIPEGTVYPSNEPPATPCDGELRRPFPLFPRHQDEDGPLFVLGEWKVDPSLPNRSTFSVKSSKWTPRPPRGLLVPGGCLKLTHVQESFLDVEQIPRTGGGGGGGGRLVRTMRGRW